MIQIDMKAIAHLLAEQGDDLANHPNLAAQIMVLNEKLAATPGFTVEVMMEMLTAMLNPPEDERF